MDDFSNQLDHNLSKDIATFNNESKYKETRELYKNNFTKIVELINKFNPKGAVEDISNLDASLRAFINSEILLLKEINRGIKEGKIEEKDII